MRSTLVVALAGIVFQAANADTCQEEADFNKQYGGADKCRETAQGMDYTYVAGSCAKDNCYVFGLNQCTQSGCADLMGSWDCPTKAQCDAARSSADHVQGAGAPTCTFFEKASDPQGRDGWECSNGTWCVDGFDKDRFSCNQCEAYGQRSTQASCQSAYVMRKKADGWGPDGICHHLDIPEHIGRDGECWNFWAMFGWSYYHDACSDIWEEWDRFCECQPNLGVCLQLGTDIDNNVNDFWGDVADADEEVYEGGEETMWM